MSTKTKLPFDVWPLCIAIETESWWVYGQGTARYRSRGGRKVKARETKSVTNSAGERVAPSYRAIDRRAVSIEGVSAGVFVVYSTVT